jgi:hypothetical protein
MKKNYRLIVLIIIFLFNSFLMNGMFLGPRYAARTRSAAYKQNPPSGIAMPRTAVTQKTAGGSWWSRLFGSSTRSLASDNSSSSSWWTKAASFIPLTKAHAASSQYEQMKNSIAHGALPTYYEVSGYWNLFQESGYKADLDAIVSMSMPLLLKAWQNAWNNRDKGGLNKNNDEGFYHRSLGMDRLLLLGARLKDSDRPSVKKFILDFNPNITKDEPIGNIKAAAEFYHMLGVFLNKNRGLSGPIRPIDLSEMASVNVDGKKLFGLIGTDLGPLASYSFNQIQENIKNNRLLPFMQSDVDLIMSTLYRCKIFKKKLEVDPDFEEGVLVDVIFFLINNKRFEYELRDLKEWSKKGILKDKLRDMLQEKVDDKNPILTETPDRSAILAEIKNLFEENERNNNADTLSKIYNNALFINNQSADGSHHRIDE